MRTIAVILPVNNPKMLNQQDLESYQSEDYYYKVSYIDTDLVELNTAEDVAKVTPLVVKKIITAEKEGASVVVVYAFGDVGIKESKDHVSIPVMGLGRLAVQEASLQCRKSYTVIPARLSHNAFIETLVKEENCQKKFVASTHAVNMNPSEVRDNPKALEQVVQAVVPQIENGIDTFTFGCGSLIGIAKPLEKRLKELNKFNSINIIDHVAIPLKAAKEIAKEASQQYSSHP